MDRPILIDDGIWKERIDSIDPEILRTIRTLNLRGLKLPDGRPGFGYELPDGKWIAVSTKNASNSGQESLWSSGLLDADGKGRTGRELRPFRQAFVVAMDMFNETYHPDLPRIGREPPSAETSDAAPPSYRT